jgi:CPA1 family monovalent cation:H+ antiporter
VSLFEVVGALLALTAALAYVNERHLHLPTPIGVTLGGLVTSLALLLVAGLAPERRWLTGLLAHIDFEKVLLEGLLGIMLFAGALEVDLEELMRVRTPVLVLSVVGTVLSTLLVGTAIRELLRLIGLEIPFLWALLFGALISPTDPIAVMGLLSEAGASPELATLVTGESLFNDGVAVVLFTIILGLVTGEHGASAVEAGRLFLEEAVGGVVYGLALGWTAYYFLRRLDEPTTEILITVAVTTAGYALANRIGTSGPLAMVVAGLLVGNRGRMFAMSEGTRQRLDNFWLVLDEILNALLFVLIGLEVLILPVRASWLLAGGLAIPLILGARLLSVYVPMRFLPIRTELGPYAVRVLTWGGLRGGIAIALALSLPAGRERGLLLLITYVVVVFSILVQGLTIKRVARGARLLPRRVLEEGS